MADVYKAKDHKLNRFVAIKVMKAEFQHDEGFLSKFRVEAQAAAGLTHANIVNVYDVGIEGGIYFIVMELVEGITLKDYIKTKGRLSARETTGIALQIASGLEAAHKSGIIHRDIKPQNIILSKDGTAKVADFGIARAVSSDTIGQSVMGSVHYSAPEQARGGYSDARSDLYSLGITMYEMLTGRVPFDGDSTVEVALKHLQQDMVAPREILPDLPRAIEAIILRCTEKSPDLRYQTMTDMIADLRQSLADPAGSFVKSASQLTQGTTQMLSREEVAEINQRAEEGQPGALQGEYVSGETAGPETSEPAGEGDALSLAPEKVYEEGLDQDADADLDLDLTGDLAGKKTGRRFHLGTRIKPREGGGSGRGRTGHTKLVAAISVSAVLLVALTIFYLFFYIYGRFSGHAAGQGESETAVLLDLTGDVVKVPQLLGKTENEAQAALKSAKLSFRYLGEESSSDYPTGTVMTQSPEAGTKIKEGATVAYKLSTGSAQSLTVPDLTDKTDQEAEDALSSMGLGVVVDNTRYSDTVEEGKVITTNPGAGSAVHEGDVVTLYISQGRDSQSVKVPSVVGKYKDDAVTLLTNYGLYVYAVGQPSASVQEGLVISQDLEPDSSVQSGSSITIAVSTGPSDQGDIVAGAGAGGQKKQTGKWMSNAQLNAPAGYSGGRVRIVLDQKGTKKTVYEGEISFPYLLQVQGEDGVDTGNVTLYELDKTGEAISATEYQSIDFSPVG